MRVISGSARGTILKTIQGMETRPTTDRIKETLFNMIQGDLYDSRFLDLFSGSGAIGIEALSRGAASCTFVEQSREAAGCIRDNLAKTHLEDKAALMECDVFSALHRMSDREKPFDIVFMDPPYNHDLELQVLELLKNVQYIDSDTTIIVEASKDTKFDYLEELGYEPIKIKEYKTNKHLFVRKK